MPGCGFASGSPLSMCGQCFALSCDNLAPDLRPAGPKDSYFRVAPILLLTCQHLSLLQLWGKKVFVEFGTFLFINMTNRLPLSRAAG